MTRKLNWHYGVRQGSGFTIIEVLIATAIFSVVLLVLVVGVISFYSGYYKSLASTSTQNATQNISDIVERAIKFSSTTGTVTSLPPTSAMAYPSSGSLGVFCIGGTEFAYYLGEPHTTSSGPPFVLDELPEPGTGCINTLTGPTGLQSQPSWNERTSLLGDNYRLLVFSATQIPSRSWAIHIKVAYTTGGTNDAGDDLLCSTVDPVSGPGGCKRSAANANNISYTTDLTALPNYIECRSGAGSQFCDVAELQSVADVRIN